MAIRALFIGLGGTGGVSLAFTKARLAARLRSAGWTDGFPEKAWSFVHIDVPATSDIGPRLDSAEAGDALALGTKKFSGSEYQNLVTSGMSYGDLDHRALGHTKPEALAGWRHRDPRQVTVPIERGAGQFRSVGALIALATRERIAQGLQGAHNELLGDQSLTEAHRISAQLSGGSDFASDAPQVFIVTSMIGGAGAGMVLEVASVARELFGNWVSAYMVAPEGFNLNSVGNAAPANAWALVSELQYLLAAGANDHVPVAGERLLYPSTARALFVLGRQSNNVNLTGDGAVEKVIGETLASVVTRDEIFTDLVAYAITNELKVDKLGLGKSGGFRSMGFGRLELGRDRFGRYATDRLTGLVGERLSSLHVPRRTKDDGTEERHVDAVKNVASSLRYAVAEQAGLFELDDATGNHDQILSTLAPAPFNSWSPGRLLERLTPGDVKISDLIHQLKEWGRGRTQNDRSEWQDQLSENIKSWTTDVEERLFKATVTMVAEHGLPVATATLSLIREDLSTARGQLQRIAETTSKLQLSGQIGEIVPAGIEGIATQDQRSKMAKVTSDFLATRFSGLAHEAAADACDQVSENLVAPLQQALEAASGLVRSPDGEWAKQLELLPIDGGSQAYLPASYEVVIESVESFDQQFAEKISETVVEERRDAAISTAVTEALEQFADRWISIDAGWSPGTIGGIESVPQPLRVSTQVEPQQMMDVARSWMDRPDYPIGAYLGAGLKDYVSQGPSEVKAFTTALSTLIQVANPLGRVNQGHVDAIHGGRNLDWAFSAFPFLSLDDDLKEAVCDVINGADEIPGDAEEDYVKWVAAERDSIELVSSEGPYQALCFETIMSPIRRIWEPATRELLGERRELARNGVMSKFGSSRHTFPMTMTGPLAFREQKELIQGYLLAVASGRFKDWSVKSETFEAFLPLPEHAYPIDQDDYRTYASKLGELLEDLKVAYLEASGEKDRISLEPYKILVQLGQDPQAEIAKLKGNDTQLEELKQLLNAVEKAASEAEEPNQRIRERSSDLYELGDVLIEAVIGLKQKLSGSSERVGF